MTQERKKPSGSGEISPGDILGSYVIERKLGSGGMADVYFAVHQELSRPAALKVLRSSLAVDSVHLQRFMQEARAAAALIHPNIVQVYDVGRDENLHYIAGEYIPGCNLREYLAGIRAGGGGKPKTIAATQANGLITEVTNGDAVSSDGSRGNESNGHVGASDAATSDDAGDAAPSISVGDQPADRPLGIRESLSILLQVLAALNKSAKAGIVHRDIKPENIMLTPEGDAKVADFGLARVLLGDDPHLTRAGTTLGTPMYMSPEQIQDGDIDIRSDLYSLGVTLYHMLAGEPPFKGDTPLALAMQHVQAKPKALELVRIDVPPTLASVVNRLLEKTPEQRYASPHDVIEALQESRGGDLSEYWPEQTVPLPGVQREKQVGLYRETLVLAQRLRENRFASSGIWRWAVAVIVVAAAFAAGFWGSTQPSLFATAGVVNPTPLEKTALEQYEAALLAGTASLQRAQAVIDYHDQSDGQYWVDLAKIQIAKLHERSGSVSEASRALDELLRESTTDPVHVALARLIKADMADENGRVSELEKAARVFRSLPESQRNAQQFAPWVSAQTFESWQTRVN